MIFHQFPPFGKSATGTSEKESAADNQYGVIQSSEFWVV
jgi:hypothetical protein